MLQAVAQSIDHRRARPGLSGQARDKMRAIADRQHHLRRFLANKAPQSPRGHQQMTQARTALCLRQREQTHARIYQRREHAVAADDDQGHVRCVGKGC
jgi:hypothetical protein